VNRRAARHGGPAPTGRARRGRGVRALNPDGTVPTPLAEPEQGHGTGRRPWDFGGRTVYVGFLALAVVVGLTLAGVVLAAAVLYAQGAPVGPFLSELQTPLVGLVGLLVATLVAQFTRKQATAMRSQKTINDNTFATAARVDAVAASVAAQTTAVTEVREQVGALRQDLANLSAAAVDAVAAGRVTAAVDELSRLLDAASKTGPLRVVTVLADPPPPMPAAAPVRPTSTAPTPMPAVPPAPPAAPTAAVDRAQVLGQGEADLDALLERRLSWTDILGGVQKPSE